MDVTEFERKGAGAQLTSAEVLLVRGEAARAPDGPGGHPRDLAGRDGGHRGEGVRPRLLVAVLGVVDVGGLGKAEVSAKVVDTLHPPFAGVVYQSTLIDV